MNEPTSTETLHLQGNGRNLEINFRQFGEGKPTWVRVDSLPEDAHDSFTCTRQGHNHYAGYDFAAAWSAATFVVGPQDMPESLIKQ